jgi:hypothetical protein
MYSSVEEKNMSLKQKRALEKFSKLVSKTVTADSLKDVVEGVISDVKSGMFPDDANLTPMHTAGDLRANPSLERDDYFIEHAVAAAAGRFLRKIAEQLGPDSIEIIMNDPKGVQIIDSTNEAERKAIDWIIKRQR